MPNGFYGSDEEWKRMERPLLEVENDLQVFADKKGLKISKNYHNWPERSLTWSSRNIERLIQISVESDKHLTFTFWVCAYSDKQGKRFWKNKNIKKAVEFSKIKNKIQDLLEEGFTLAESWSENDLLPAT